MKRILAHISWMTWGLLLSIGELRAQSPTHIDTKVGEPKPFTLDDILLYIVFPLILVAIAIWARRYRQKQKKEEEKANETRAGNEPSNNTSS